MRMYQKNAHGSDTLIMPGRGELLRTHVRCSRCEFHYDVLDAVHDYKITVRSHGETINDALSIIKEDADLSDEEGNVSMLESMIMQAMMIHVATFGHEIRLTIDRKVERKRDRKESR